MSRRKPFPSRPEESFRIGTVRWNLENVATHVRAGFAPVPDEVVRAHFFRYLEFLQRQSYLLQRRSDTRGISFRAVLARSMDRAHFEVCGYTQGKRILGKVAPSVLEVATGAVRGGRRHL